MLLGHFLTPRQWEVFSKYKEWLSTTPLPIQKPFKTSHCILLVDIYLFNL